MNGNGIPAPPRPSATQMSIVSPTIAPIAVPNDTNTLPSIQKLAQANEQTWLLIGRVAEQMGNLEQALSAYENALRHNPLSLAGLTQVAGIARIKENYPKAVDYFQRVISMQQENGEVWSALGHCYLMQDDLQKAYAAYQQALYLLPNPKEDPKLWYGIGILYDRYGSLDHAEEAFASVLKMDKAALDFDKANEILFRLGIIYKQQGKYSESLECFDRILRNPPNPLAHADIWFQIGHVFEQQRDHMHAREAYERVVVDNPNHAKVLQQLGWLYHQDGSSFQNQEVAIQYLTKSLEADPTDAQSWYLLGRAYMAGQKYNKAYEAYQQAVYRDGRNPTFWCSIGVLYFQINQYRDALDAYSRAIRINPYISEVWFDLGSLYESCNNQISDAIDAYARAAELDPSNTAITQRLQLLRTAQATGSALPAAPGPQDVHPTAYANSLMQPHGLGGPPLLMQPGAGSRPPPIFRTDSRGPPGELALPMPPQQISNGRSSPGPFRGGPPPPVVLDDNRHMPSHTPLAPMDVDRPPVHAREASAPYPPSARENGPRGPAGQSLLLHHPVPQQQLPTESIRGAAHGQGHQHEPPSARYRMHQSRSPSPQPHALRPASVANGRPAYAEGRPPVGPGQPPMSSRGRSPPSYREQEREPNWDRRLVPVQVVEHADWDRRGRPGVEYASHQQPMYVSPPLPQRAPSPRGPRERSVEMSPAAHHAYARQYWDARTGLPSGPAVIAPRSPIMHEQPGRRYDPRYDAPSREYERPQMMDARSDGRYGSPEVVRARDVPPPSAQPPLPPQPTPYARTSESPGLVSAQASDAKDRRRRGAKDKDSESVSSGSVPAAEPPKKERRTRRKRVKEEPARQETPGYGGAPPPGYRQAKDSPGPSSNASGTGSVGRSVQPSPTGSAHHPPARVVDEDYDEGVAEMLMEFAAYRPGDPRGYPPPPGAPVGGRGPPQQSPHVAHRRSSLSSRTTPPLGTKRALSPGPGGAEERDGADYKRSRVGSMNSHRVSPPSGGRPTPTPSAISPAPFRTQSHAHPSHSPETRQPAEARSYPPSPSLPTMLPPHPRPIGASGHAGMSLPPMARSSPPHSSHQSTEEERHARSVSPLRPKREIVLHQAAPGPAGGSPPGAKGTPSPSSTTSNGRTAPIP
ncbi:uncharacterized protein FIBRA_08554 [Fibroporia radiculosa]|uniref:Cytochrome c-type biogenesis protein H TPR domain-containing protein n=1 Tax=Fibroporia radiculosa TaxID=599839 RepID=J4GHP6_9APHY|nr:uncharacterized protein FIBRA_08554 [Fibroporia radiculosa]CCM06303.1 predicted protein [Fibroporia radiculosa]